MGFLVDTDICSAHLRNKGDVTQKFMQHTGRIAISVPPSICKIGFNPIGT